MIALVRLVLLSCIGACTTAAAAEFTFRFNDAPGTGFLDTTPFIPVGNNTATTLGEARRNMLMEAGRIWGSLLVSTVPIKVDAVFATQDCDANSGTLASAGARTFFREFTTDPRISRDTFFASALADSIARRDLMQDVQGSENDPDIRVTFNVSVDSSPTCLNQRGFYYGFDHNKGTQIDALVVALHELAHGFGFASEINTSTGTGFNSDDGIARFSSYVMQIFDEQRGQGWPALTPAQRVTSAVGNAGLAWNGTNVNAQIGLFSVGATNQGRLRLFSPTPISEGSSVSHWDRSVTPNILMEPNISVSLTTNFLEVTACALRDIGWQTMRCPDTPPNGVTPVVGSQTVTVVEDTPITFAVSATDGDTASLIIAVNTPRPQKGVAIGTVGTTPTVTYTPLANASGADTFNFTASDGNTISTPATVSIMITPVNDPPTAGSFSANVTSGQPAVLNLVGSDVDGDSITFEIVGNPTSGTLTGGGSTRTYQSSASFVGLDTFTYRTRDPSSSLSTTAVVTINVAAAAAPTPPPGNTPTPGGGGGGAMNELLLLALALLALSARLHKRGLVLRA